MTNNPATAPGARTFLGLYLQPGVFTGQMLTFYLACYAAIMLATFVPQTQPFLLADVLQIETERQGVVSGQLNFWGEIVIIVTVGLWGSLSDRVGRRVVTALGFLLAAAGIMLYGLVLETAELAQKVAGLVQDDVEVTNNTNLPLTGLLLARVVYSAGIAAVSTMLITLMADYVADASRGKATGLLGIMNGLGAMTAALALLKLPALFQARGMGAEQAAYSTYALMALVTLLLAGVMFASLRRAAAEQREARVPIMQQLRSGIGEARRPLIALAYAASFVARGNLAVVGTFFTLWASVYGTRELGLDAAEAVARGGAVVAVSYVASLLSAPLFGFMTDKINRTSALAVTLAISAVGYGSTFFVEDPFSVPTIACLVLIGMAEVGCIITSGVLIAEQAPDRIRGSVVGVFTLTGAIGILIASIVGGYLFDHWMQTGPFVFFGMISLVVLAWAVALRLRGR